MLDTNKVYEISNHANGLYAATYLSLDDSGVSLMNKNDDDIDDYNLKWFLFPIDDDQYIITSYAANNCKVWNVNNDKINVSTYSSTNSIQKWQIKANGSSYVIQSDNGKVLTAGTGQALGLIRLTDESSNNPNQQWNLTSVQTIQLPQKPIIDTKLKDYPKYSPTGNIDNGTSPQLMGWTLVPCIMVNDPNIDKNTQIKTTPYYILKQYQYWQRAVGSNVALRPHEKKSYTYEWGTEIDQKTTIINTLGFQINIDSGMKFDIPEVGGGTDEIKTQLNEELKIEYSHETKIMEKYQEQSEIDNPTDQSMNSIGFLTITSLELYRYNGSEIRIMQIQTSDNDTYNVTSYPNHQQALLLLTNHSYEEVEEITNIPKSTLKKLKKYYF